MNNLSNIYNKEENDYDNKHINELEINQLEVNSLSDFNNSGYRDSNV